MLFFKDEVSYILPKLKREMGLWQLFLLRQGCLQWLEKSSPTKIFFFRIKVGKKLSNSPISGKTGYKLTLKSKDQQSFGKPHYFRTTYCCLNVYRNPVRATSNEISCFEVDLCRSVFSFANIIKKKEKGGDKATGSKLKLKQGLSGHCGHKPPSRPRWRCLPSSVTLFRLTLPCVLPYLMVMPHLMSQWVFLLGFSSAFWAAWPFQHPAVD